MSLPLHQNLLKAANLTTLQNPFRDQANPPMMYRRQHWCSLRGRPMERLEKTNMKNIVQTSTQRQLKTIRHITHAIEDFEWTKILGPQLPTTMNKQRSHGTMKQPQPNPIPRTELQLSVMLVILSLVELLGLFQTIPNLHQKFIAVPKLLTDCS